MFKIDIHNTTKRKESALKLLRNDPKISASQKKNFLRFIEECEMGKNGKKVSDGRLAAYIGNFRRLYSFFGKDIDKITEKEAENFYKALETDRFKQKNGRSLRPGAKNEYIKILKKYLKWSLGDDRYRKIVGWIKKYTPATEKFAISLAEVEKLMNVADSPKDKALIMFLFDSGARIQEALNILIKDVEIQVKSGDEGSFYIVDIKYSKTLPRRISIPLAARYITEWLKVHPDKNNPEAQLFPATYDGVSMMLVRLSKKVLEKRVTPHILRHSSATYYARKMKPYPFCYRYGWTIGSNQARTYIDRSLLGEEEQEKLVNLIEADRLQKLEEENKKLRESISVLKSEQEKITADMKERKRMDPVLNKIFKNEKIMEFV